MVATQLSPHSPTLRFALLPLEDFAMLPFGGFIDKLRFTADEADSSQQRLCSWKVVGHQQQVRSSSGVLLNIDQHVDDIELTKIDYLVIFGSRTAKQAIEQSNQYGDWIKRAAANGTPLVTLDNGSFLLAKLGLLSNHEVAIHWRHEQEFRSMFPKLRVTSDKLYQFDGKRITCAGGSASIDLAAEILAKHFDQPRALKGLADMLVDETREPVHILRSTKDEYQQDSILNSAIRLMRLHLADATSLEDIAQRIGISRRQLDRKFHAFTQQTAHHYWLNMRLDYAKWRLVNSTLTLSTIADEINVSDASYLSKLLMKRFGQTPNQIRIKNGLEKPTQM
ncbi:helix-turn-helix domain-containing protein [Vibrio sp. SCSIO 43135]|uniref:GlxA family transcriptional regulator n=1 Tax=Vibrio sp. SCSIO 43135 TaxID=2819096 RepID=UPI002075F2B7|nr:helix-turn-helix domain-containing protein [Vibrio sp. SCSIO 43135]USD43353.1 helix-turn-helix domain-containing protein [Vibrio sp. SCSIO 43135]